MLFFTAFYVIIYTPKVGDMMNGSLEVTKSKTAADYWEEADFTEEHHCKLYFVNLLTSVA